MNFSVVVTARALVVQEGCLLLVSNDNKLWYTPGGKILPGESLFDCLKREVYEETSLKIEVKNLLYTFEFINSKEGSQKIEFFFLAEIKEGTVYATIHQLGSRTHNFLSGFLHIAGLLGPSSGQSGISRGISDFWTQKAKPATSRIL